MVVRDDEVAARTERARAIGLFRYRADPRAGRSGAVEQGPRPAGPRDRRPRAHRPGRAAPAGSPATPWTAGSGRGAAAGSTRWCPTRASPRPRLPVEVIEMAVALKRENPARTADAGAADPARPDGVGARGADPATPLRRRPADRRGARRARRRRPAAARRCSAGSRPTARTSCGPGTPCTGPRSAGARPTCSRSSTTTPGRSSGTGSGSPRTPCAWPRRCARRSASRGVPDGIYVDNGSAFVDAWLLRACAKLGHPADPLHPGPPAGPRQDRTVLPDRPRAVPRRDHRRAHHRRRRRPGPAPGRRSGRAEPAVHRLGRDRLPPPRSTPRPGTRRSRAGTPAARSRCPPRPRWPRRSSGRPTARSPRPRWCRCRATPTRSTRCWSGTGSSWCSTPST